MAGFGVDVLRMWVASSDYTTDVSISLRLLNDAALALRKLRNTARFVLGNLFDYPGDEAVTELLDIDHYMLHRIAEFDAEMSTHYAGYAFHSGPLALSHLCLSSLNASSGQSAYAVCLGRDFGLLFRRGEGSAVYGHARLAVSPRCPTSAPRGSFTFCMTLK